MAIKLGDIDFGLGVNTNGLRTGLRILQNFGEKVDKVSRRQSEGAEKTAKAYRAQEKAMVSALHQTQKLQRELTKMDASTALIKEAEEGFKKYTMQLSRGEVKALTFLRANERLEANLKRVANAAKDAAAEKKKLEAANISGSKATEAQTRALQKAAAEQERQTQRIKANYISLADAARTLSRTRAQTVALNIGGTPELEKLNAQFARQDLVREYNRQLTAAGVGFADAQKRTREYASALDALGIAQSKAITKTSLMSRLIRDSTLLFAAYSGPLGLFAAQVLSIGDALDSTGTFATKTSYAIGLAAVGIVTLGISMFNAAKEVSAVKAQFVAISGELPVANLLLEEARKVADSSGQTFASTAAQYARFNAAAKGTVFQGKQTADMFEVLAKVTGQLQLPVDQAEGVFRAFEQMLSKGKVQAEELRNQLGDRLPGAFGIAARSMGVTTEQLSDMLQKGEVLSKDFLPKFVEELKRTFNTTQEIDSMQASLNRLTNANNIFLTSLDSAIGFSAAVKSGIEGLTSALTWLANNLTQVTALAGAFGAALVALRIQSVITSIAGLATVVGGSLAGAFRMAAGAVAAWSAAMMANPVTGIISLMWKVVAAVTAAAGAYWGLSAAMDDSKQKADALRQETDGLLRSMKRVGETGGVVDGVVGRWDKVAKKSGAEIKKLRTELFETAEIASKTGMGASRLTEINAKLKEQTKIYNEATKAAADLKKAAAKVEEQAMGTEAPTVNGIKIPEVKIPKMPKMPKIRQAERGAEIARLAREERDAAEQMREALHTTTTEISEMQQKLFALRSGGVAALERLNEEFTKQRAMEQYAETLKKTGLELKEIDKRLQDYSKTYDAYNKQLRESEAQIELAREIEAAYSRAYDSIGDALSDMVVNAKYDFKTLLSTVQNVLADLAKTALEIEVLNPIKQSLFGSPDEKSQGTKTQKPSEMLNDFFSSMFTKDSEQKTKDSKAKTQTSIADDIGGFFSSIFGEETKKSKSKKSTSVIDDVSDFFSSIFSGEDKKAKKPTDIFKDLAGKGLDTTITAKELKGDFKGDFTGNGTFTGDFSSLFGSQANDFSKLFSGDSSQSSGFNIGSLFSNGEGGGLGEFFTSLFSSGGDPATAAAMTSFNSGGGGGSLGSLSSFGFARKGAAFTTPLQRMRTGGILNSPTMFSSGERRVVGGEAGAEAIMPLTRLGNGELGVRAAEGNKHVNVTINTPNPQAFSHSRAQISSTLKRALGKGKNGNA